MFKYITIGILVPLLVSCIFDGNYGEPEKMESAMVSFSLDIDSPTVTKAGETWGDEYTQKVGEGLENMIDLNSLIVFAYETDGTYVADLPILKKGADAQGKVVFTCGLDAGIYEAEKQYKFVVLANCTNSNYGISYGENGPNLDGLVYTTPFIQTMPMWGAVTCALPASVPENKIIDIGEISVLRAAAKIGVELSDDVIQEGYLIKSLKINYVASSGYSVPEDWEAVASTLAMSRNQGFRPAEGTLSDVDAFTTGTTSRFIYVPETANGNDELSISVTVTNDGEEFEFPYENGIKFRNYVSGLPDGDKFNIVRNHFYDYTITKINVGLELNLTVSDWFEGPTWDLDQYESPQNTNILPAPFENATAPTEVPVVRYTNGTEEGACTVFFKMSGPMGISSWKPTLLNASARDYAVRVYEVEINGTDYVVKNEEITGDIPANADKFYAIKVVAINQAVLARTEPINLGIGYNAQWNPENISLLVVNSNSYWPAPTDYENDQLYVQIVQEK